METKKCSKCGTILPVSDFNKDARFSDGLAKYCKPCLKAYRSSGKSNSGGGKLLRVYSNPDLSRYTPR